MGLSRKNTGVGGHALLQGIFPTQGSNLGLLNCRQILYRLSHQGSSITCKYRISGSHYFLPLSVQPFLRILTLWWIRGPRSLIWLLVSANCDDHTPPFSALYYLALCPGCWALHATSPRLPCSLSLSSCWVQGWHAPTGYRGETAVGVSLPCCLHLGQ